MAEQPKATGGQPYQSTGVSNTPVEARPNTLAQAGINKNLAHRARKFGRMEGQGLVKRKSL